MAELVATIDGLDPERIVVGLPLTLRGEDGAQAAETLRVRGRSSRRAAPCPVDTYDERFTTALAAASGGGRTRTPWPPPTFSRGI